MLARFSRFAAAALLASGLAACFQPLHGPQFGAVQPQLASIDVETIQGHFGHQLKSELDFLLTNGTPPVAPLYKLTTTNKGTSSSVIVNVESGRPQMMNYDISVNFVLTEIATSRVVSYGTARGNVSYDRTTQRYASVRAQRDAEIRAAKLLAEQIRTRIVADLARGLG